jgi:hypothetical protein
VPVPSSSGGMLAIGSFAPGDSTGACPLGVCRQTVDALLTHQNHHRLAADGYQSVADGYGSAPPPLEPLMSKLPVLTLQAWESALAPEHSANTRNPSIR